MATMTKRPERELHNYISDVSEWADVRAGSPLPMGTQESGGGVNFAIFSRYSIEPKTQHPSGSSTLIQPAIAQATSGTFG